MRGRRLCLALAITGSCLVAGLHGAGEAAAGTATGAGAPAGLTPAGALPLSGGDPPGILYFSEDFNGNGLFTISMIDGSAVNLGSSGVTGATVGLAPSADDRVLLGSKPVGLLLIATDGSGAEDVGGTSMAGMAFSAASGAVFGADGGDLFIIDENGFIIENLASTPDGADVEGIAFGDGGVYGLARDDTRLFFYDPAGDEWSVVGDTQLEWPGAGLAFNTRESALYAKAASDATLYRLDPATGVPTAVGDTGSTRGGGLAWVDEFVDPCGDCPCLEDITRDGVVDVADLLRVLAEWGPCPSAPRGGGGLGLWGLTSTSPARLYRIDPETGEATDEGELDGNADLCGLSFLGDVLYGSDVSGYPGGSGGFDTGVLDPEAGTITFLSDQDGSFNWHGLASDELGGVLYSVDLDAGGFPLTTLTPDGTLGTVGSGTGVQAIGLAFDDAQDLLYAVGFDNALHRIDVATGESERVGALGIVVFGQAGLAFDEDTRTLFMNVGPTGMLYTVDVDSGAATLVGANGLLAIDGLAWLGQDICGSCPCAPDITRDRVVDVADILRLLAEWGPCP